MECSMQANKSRRQHNYLDRQGRALHLLEVLGVGAHDDAGSVDLVGLLDDGGALGAVVVRAPHDIHDHHNARGHQLRNEAVLDVLVGGLLCSST